MRNTQATQLLFELSKPGRRSSQLPACDVDAPELEQLLPADALSHTPARLPELAEPDVVRHYTNLSTMNMSVDANFYPLG